LTILQIVLTVRDEDSWVESMKVQAETGNSWIQLILRLLSPTQQNLMKFLLAAG